MTGPAVNTGLTFDMTVDAASHAMDVSLADSVHFYDFAMAGCARHICGNVTLVAEVNEIRQIVDLDPGDGLSRFPIADKLLDVRLLFSNTLVAAHTKLHGWNPRDNRFAGVDMTIKTVNFVIACVELVTEINRLQGCGLTRVECNERYYNHDGERCGYYC